jgi:hypothetical protein
MVGPRACLDDVKKNFLTLSGLELRPLGRPARSQSLYRLSYPASRLQSNEGLLRAVGRAIALAVSRRLSNAKARVRFHVRSCGIFSGKSGAKAGFLGALRFPLPILIPSNDPHNGVRLLRNVLIKTQTKAVKMVKRTLVNAHLRY